MRDVANQAGVSIKTVSRVVNGEPHVRPETARQVLRAIGELGWVANEAARSMRTGKTNRLGIAVSGLRRPRLARLVESIVHEADGRGMTAVVEPTHEDMARLTRIGSDLGQHFDGLVVVAPTQVPDELVDALRGMPVVAVQSGRPDIGWDSVDDDVGEAVALICRHLSVMGRTSVALLGPDRAVGPHEETPSHRMREAMASVGLDSDVLYVALEGTDPRAAGASAAQEALLLRPRLDAVVCSDDEVALGALWALDRAGVTVPDDVAVIGYDALSDGVFSTPSLTTVDPMTDRIAHTALALLVERIAGEAPAEPRSVLLPVELLRRESTMGSLWSGR